MASKGDSAGSRRWFTWRGVLLVSAAIVVGVAAVGFSVRYYALINTSRAKIEMLERAVQDLRAAMNVDSIRHAAIQKVMYIIEQYNPDMPSSQKYEIANEIYNMSLKYTNLDVDLLSATITHETANTWDPNVISKAGAMGLMQIMPATGMFIAQYEGINWTSKEDVLLNPIYNIRIGSRYLSSLIEMYGVDGGLAAYNGGEKRAALWLANGRAEGILWSETSQYIPSVLGLYEEYRGLTF
jgi:soluble lytic murein transglycosylase